MNLGTKDMGDQGDSNSSPGTSPTARTRRRSGSGFKGARLKDPTTARPSQQHPLIGSPPSSAMTDPETMTSPQTPSKRTERIFPISSVVNPLPTPGGLGAVEPLRSASSNGRWSASSPTPYIENTNPFEGDKLYLNFNEELDRQRHFKELEAARVASAHDASGANVGVLKHPMTMRFEHKETEEGHCVVTGLRDFHLARCEDEPIHLPGAVQGFGVLIVIREDENQNLLVRVVSENSGLVLGLSPHYLFSLASFTDLLNQDQENTLRDHITFCRDEQQEPHELDGPEVFLLSGTSQDQRGEWKCWCAMHIVPQTDLICLEFELEEDHLFPLAIPLDEQNADKMGMNVEPYEPTEEDLSESTTKESRPLRLLNRRQQKNKSPMEHFSILSQVNEQLAAATDLKQFVKIVVGVFKEITGFHRVMVYQFDEKWNGQVVAELVDWNATKDLYRGLHFPATDIPAQARELYTLNKVRLLYDRDQPSARLVCRTEEDLQRPLDMTHSYLRAMSPIHIKYLGNMGVRASMSISIVAFKELWGLISCHSYGIRGMRISFVLRKLCRLVGETVSRNIERLSLSQRLHARKLINTSPTEKNPGGYIVTRAEDLLSLFDADFGVLSIGDEGKILGPVENSQEVMAALQYLRLKRLTTIQTSQDLRRDYAEMITKKSGFDMIAGLLLVPLSREGRDFIVFFRHGQLQQVHWAGNPYEKVKRDGSDGLIPRKSFKVWSETVIGKCRDWTDEQLETAAVLHLVYGKFIEVWRQKEEALQSTRMASLLLNNASHEVRTPLNAIINYLEIALEGHLDKDTREHLVKSYAASKSLIYVINDLLDLTRTEAGNDLFRHEAFNLPATINEAVRMFEHDPQRSKLELRITIHPGIPQVVLGDHVKIRQVVSNVIANAIKHTGQGNVSIDVMCVDKSEEEVQVEISVADTGSGISPRKLDAIFQNFEQVESNDTEIEQGTGLGLAIVARIVRNMNGQLRAESEVGRGSKFTFAFNFPLPNMAQEMAFLEAANATPQLDNHQISFSAPVSPERLPPYRHSAESSLRPSNTRRQSNDSIRSGGSTNSGRSEIDQLVQMISSPSLEEAPRSSNRSIKRRSSPTAERGEYPVQDSGVPIRSVKIPEDEVDAPAASGRSPTNPSSLTPSNLTPARSPASLKGATQLNRKRLHVLVSEDDPVNRAILKKRLEMDGHEVTLTKDGSEAVETFGASWRDCDIILMDLQMPILDGVSATKQIRSDEIRHSPPGASPPRSHGHNNNRVPIFAVSASLPESRADEITEAQFDGWILKPINFRRLGELMAGIWDYDRRRKDLYTRGGKKNWERGGWLIGPPS